MHTLLGYGSHDAVSQRKQIGSRAFQRHVRLSGGGLVEVDGAARQEARHSVRRAAKLGFRPGRLSADVVGVHFGADTLALFARQAKNLSMIF